MKTQSKLTAIVIFAAISYIYCDKPIENRISQSVESDSVQLQKKIEAGAIVLDVRTAEEFASGHHPKAINIPVDDIKKRMGELNRYKDAEIIVYCRSGRRSAITKSILLEQSFSKIIDAGGYANMPAGGQQ